MRDCMQAMRKTIVIASAVGLLCVSSSGSPAHAQQNQAPIVSEAASSGDQLVFFYDSRPNRVTFLTVGNDDPTGVVVEVVFYSQTLQRIAEQVVVLAGGSARIIDPTAVAGVTGTAGLAVFTPIQSEVNHTPIVPVRPLVGGFTIVNTVLGAGTGGNPFGRLAIGAQAQARAQPGFTVDGTAIFYQWIQPKVVQPGAPGFAPSLTFPVYFNPSTLSPPDQDGNRLFFASFTDQYAAPVGPQGAARFNLVPLAMNVTTVFFNGTNGNVVVGTTPNVTGVRFDTLQGLSGNAALTSGGRLEISVPQLPPSGSFFGMGSQALGTFAVGQPFVPVDF